MPTPEWDETQDAWVTRLDTEVFGNIEVMIKTDGEETPPTERQMSTLELISSLPATLLDTIPSDARQYAKGYMMEDEFDEMEEADFQIRFSACMIPRLRDTAEHYFFLIGESEIDEEHGIACLFKNHESCRVCHTDAAYENYGWEDSVELELVLR